MKQKWVVTMSTLKNKVHEMVEALPEEKIVLLKRFLDDLINANKEDKSWLEADLGEFPPYDWGTDGPPKGKTVKYQPGVGLVVQEE